MSAPMLARGGAHESLSIPFVDAAELVARLPWHEVVGALDAALTEFDGSVAVDRTAVEAAGGELLVMPASNATMAGIKLVGVGTDNQRLGLPRIQGLYVLFDGVTLSPVALIDGTMLTTLRTAGQSAVIVDRFAPEESRRLVVFGSGPQARAHIQAIASVRPIESVRIIGRRLETVAELCADLHSEQHDVRPGAHSDLSTADIVVCATNSKVPVLGSEVLSSSALVVAVGSHTPEARELDAGVFARADLVLVEHRATALREAGDLIQAIAAGAVKIDDVVDFTDLRASSGRVRAPGLTVYKSVGLAYQDLALADHAYRTVSSAGQTG